MKAIQTTRTRAIETWLSHSAPRAGADDPEPVASIRTHSADTSVVKRPRVKVQGWLWKEGAGNVRRFKRRWFVLTSGANGTRTLYPPEH